MHQNLDPSKPNKTYEYYTPYAIIDAARATMGGIDVDPSSSVEANRVVKAQTFYTKEQNGLEQDWWGNVWMNPPFTRGLMREFIYKLLTTVGVRQWSVLVPFQTGAKHIDALALAATSICIPFGNVLFWGPDARNGRNGKIPTPVAVYYRGHRNNHFAENFKEIGAVYKSAPSNLKPIIPNEKQMVLL